MQSETTLFNTQDDQDRVIREKLSAVYASLNERGYNSVNQIVGYLLTEDPTYITQFKNARAVMQSMDRDDIIELLVRDFLEK